MPAQSTSMVTLRNKVASHTFLKIIKTDVDNFEVRCDICVKSFTIMKTNHISDHIKGAGLSKETTLKTHQGQIVTNKNVHSEDSLSLKLTEAWVSAGLRLSALRNAKLKKVLEEGFRRPLPSADTLANKYAEGNSTNWSKLQVNLKTFTSCLTKYPMLATNIIRHSLEILVVMHSTLLLSLKSSEWQHLQMQVQFNNALSVR